MPVNPTEKAARRLMRAARAALVAQERNCRWETKGTDSARVRSVAANFEKAMLALESAEADMEEALQPWNHI